MMCKLIKTRSILEISLLEKTFTRNVTPYSCAICITIPQVLKTVITAYSLLANPKAPSREQIPRSEYFPWRYIIYLSSNAWRCNRCEEIDSRGVSAIISWSYLNPGSDWTGRDRPEPVPGFSIWHFWIPGPGFWCYRDQWYYLFLASGY